MKQIAFLILAAVCWHPRKAPDADPKQRVRAVRELGKQGDDAIAKIVPYSPTPMSRVRVEAVKALVEIGGPKTLDGSGASRWR